MSKKKIPCFCDISLILTSFVQEDLPLALVLLLHAAQLLNLYTVHLLQLQLRPAVVVVACSQALVQPLLRVWLLVLEVQLHTGLLIL
jgi:hypothetical protein